MKSYIILIISCIYLLDNVNSKSKYYDGPDRAYKFGYSIEGNQHRQETKDANGIIMGEFGFITADGVYHVTGYGTDENGNFKILYMRNIKIGLPGDPKQQAAPKNLGGATQSQTTPRPTTTAPITVQPYSEIRKFEEPKRPKASDITSCGSCIIPIIEKGVNEVIKQNVSPSANSIAQAPRTTSVNRATPSNQNSVNQNRNYPASGSPSKQTGTSSGSPSKQTGTSSAQLPGGTTSSAIEGRQGKALLDSSNTVTANKNNLNFDVRVSSQSRSEQLPQQLPSEQSSRTQGTPAVSVAVAGRGDTPESESKKTSPTGPFQQQENSRVPNGTPNSGNIPSRIPDSTSSPSKIPFDPSKMQNIINGILYKFNYTVGYHGHHEKGDQIGNKDGGYFSVGRDGYRRTVDYIANENGFQPNIKLRPADEIDIPKPETEKEAGLKGYEFKWFNLGDDKKN